MPANRALFSRLMPYVFSVTQRDKSAYGYRSGGSGSYSKSSRKRKSGTVQQEWTVVRNAHEDQSDVELVTFESERSRGCGPLTQIPQHQH